MIKSYTDESILGRAQESGSISVDVYDPRDFTVDKHRSVDSSPYGGGPGMVMQAEPILRAVSTARKESGILNEESRVFVTSARGKQFNNEFASKIVSDVKHVIIICGRYEGIDRRVIDALDAQEISVGPYILTGGELPALIVTDAIARFVPGVLGNEDSLEDERSAGTHVYTRPESFTYEGEEYTVPEVLLSGHHGKIEEWREEKAKEE